MPFICCHVSLFIKSRTASFSLLLSLSPSDCCEIAYTSLNFNAVLTSWFCRYCFNRARRHGKLMTVNAVTVDIFCRLWYVFIGSSVFFSARHYQLCIIPYCVLSSTSIGEMTHNFLHGAQVDICHRHTVCTSHALVDHAFFIEDNELSSM